MKPAPQIRVATDADTEAITAIYAHYVRHGTASFEIEPPDQSEMARRRHHIESRGLPYLVAEANHAIVGYAYAGPYHSREAYRFTVEDSIYIDAACVGQGIGRILLGALIETCQQRQCGREMVAVIGDSANVPSIRLHERFGFRHVGVLQGVGRKFDRWLDAVLMQRSLL